VEGAASGGSGDGGCWVEVEGSLEVKMEGAVLRKKEPLRHDTLESEEHENDRDREICL